MLMMIFRLYSAYVCVTCTCLGYVCALIQVYIYVVLAEEIGARLCVAGRHAQKHVHTHVYLHGHRHAGMARSVESLVGSCRGPMPKAVFAHAYTCLQTGGM